MQDVELTAVPTTVDLAGLAAVTWAYNGAVPGPEIRVGAGDVLRATFTNMLDEPTTIHWHGIALRNDMDGVPGVTQPDVGPGGEFTYEFTAPDPGTFSSPQRSAAGSRPLRTESTTYEVSALSPGTYAFHCEVLPGTMKGTFVVA